MSADRPNPRPSYLGVEEFRTLPPSEGGDAGAKPAAQTINNPPTLDEFVEDALSGGALYGAGLPPVHGILTRTTTL